LSIEAGVDQNDNAKSANEAELAITQRIGIAR
jgi:hypothetical protein